MGIEVRKVYRSGNVVGLPVKNPVGETLGHVAEVVVDLETGRVAYFAFSFGSFLGIGGKLFAIPADTALLRFDELRRYFVVNVRRELLDRAPGFDKENWPEAADPAWIEKMEAEYGREQDADEADEDADGPAPSKVETPPSS